MNYQGTSAIICIGRERKCMKNMMPKVEEFVVKVIMLLFERLFFDFAIFVAK